MAVSFTHSEQEGTEILQLVSFDDRLNIHSKKVQLNYGQFTMFILYTDQL